MRTFILVVSICFLAGCSSTGNLGIVAKSTANPVKLLESPTGYKELGPVEGKACRGFVLGIVPYGNSSFSAAVDNALQKSGGNALINVSTTTNLYGFIPIYNLFGYTCTTVNGIAIAINPSSN
jgi:hypothetical protein